MTVAKTEAERKTAAKPWLRWSFGLSIATYVLWFFTNVALATNPRLTTPDWLTALADYLMSPFSAIAPALAVIFAIVAWIKLGRWSWACLIAILIAIPIQWPISFFIWFMVMSTIG